MLAAGTAPRLAFFTALAVAILAVPSPATAVKRALFDNAHAETAGNADWSIDTDQPVPLPAQSGIGPGTPGTYWLGAISSWGVSLVKRGYEVRTNVTPLTYGDAGNPYDLSNYDVLIVDEPNTLFGASEAAAVLAFVHGGGGLVAIGNHSGSDRNNDGFDAPEIWNALDPARLLGVRFGVTGDPNNNIVQTSTNVNAAPFDSITNGPVGTVAALAFHNGTTMTLDPAANSTVRGEVWMNGTPQTSLTGVMAASSWYGAGRAFFVSDSSPADDGSAAPGNSNIFDGWGDPTATDSTLFLNATLWATRREPTVAAAPPAPALHVDLAPNPFASRTAISYVLPSAGAVKLSVFDASGRLVRVLVSARVSAGAHRVEWDGASAGGRRAPAGLYWYRLETPSGAATGKLALLK